MPIIWQNLSKLKQSVPNFPPVFLKTLEKIDFPLTLNATQYCPQAYSQNREHVSSNKKKSLPINVLPTTCLKSHITSCLTHKVSPPHKFLLTSYPNPANKKETIPATSNIPSPANPTIRVRVHTPRLSAANEKKKYAPSPNPERSAAIERSLKLGTHNPSKNPFAQGHTGSSVYLFIFPAPIPRESSARARAPIIIMISPMRSRLQQDRRSEIIGRRARDSPRKSVTVVASFIFSGGCCPRTGRLQFWRSGFLRGFAWWFFLVGCELQRWIFWA